MRIAPLFLALPLLGAGPAPAELTVALANYRFEPASIHLEHGRSYLLHLVNRSTRGHNFVAPALIAGKVEVPAGGRVDVAVVAPPAGRYPLKCTHFTHALRGMKGEIVVD